jgi:aerobic-type carbon monoxide dehydrogenase small subunit (CoxS/CutS family)
MTVPAAAVTITVDGARVETVAGIPLGAVLHARSPLLFCGMGVCFECLVTVDGRPGVRACVTPVRDGMDVVRG